MKNTMMKVLTLLWFGFWALPVLAEEALSDKQLDPFILLPQLFRWSGLVASVGIIFITMLLLRFVDNVVKKMGDTYAEKRLTLLKFNAFFKFTVYFITIITVVLLSFELSEQILTILGGTLAVAMGFAFKDLAASVIAGLMIMFDRPFQVGDRVSFGGEYGDITNIGLRSVKMQTLTDNTVTIPNNKFLNEITSCGNYGVLDMQVAIDFYIGLDQDVLRARELVREAAATNRFVYLPKPVNVSVSQTIIDNYVAIRLRLKAYVLDTKYEKEFESDVTLQILEVFIENGIQPPAILHRTMVDSQHSNSDSTILVDKNG